MATTSFDDLVERLLYDVALSGEQGIGGEELQRAVKNFYAESQSEEPAVTTNDEDLLFSDAPPTKATVVDDNLLGTVWDWLDKHPDVSIRTVENAVTQSTRLNESQILSSAGQTSNLKYASKRIFTSEERIWKAITGHGVDSSRIPHMEFQLLQVIAAHGPDGVLQPDATRITKQDKRSVPFRTDKLTAKGYICKEPVLAKNLKTAILKLKKFAKETKTFTTTQRSHDQPIVFYDAWYDECMRLLQQNDGIISFEDLRIGLGVYRKQWESKALARCMRRMVEVGCIRKLKARVEGEKDTFVRSLQLLREPTEHDRKAFTSTQDPEKSSKQKAKLSSALDKETQDVDADAALSDADEGESAVHDSNTHRMPPQWTPDIPLNNLVFNIIEEAGSDGISSMDLHAKASGPMWRRPLDEAMQKLTDVWQHSQPPHLEHLGIVRDTGVHNKITHFKYYSLPNFEKAVEAGKSEWKAVTGNQKAKGKQKARPANQQSAALDKWGFPALSPSLFADKEGRATLLQCQDAAKREARIYQSEGIVSNKSGQESTLRDLDYEHQTAKQASLKSVGATGVTFPPLEPATDPDAQAQDASQPKRNKQAKSSKLRAKVQTKGAGQKRSAEEAHLDESARPTKQTSAGRKRLESTASNSQYTRTETDVINGATSNTQIDPPESTASPTSKVVVLKSDRLKTLPCFRDTTPLATKSNHVPVLSKRGPGWSPVAATDGPTGDVPMLPKRGPGRPTKAAAAERKRLESLIEASEGNSDVFTETSSNLADPAEKPSLIVKLRLPDNTRAVVDAPAGPAESGEPPNIIVDSRVLEDNHATVDMPSSPVHPSEKPSLVVKLRIPSARLLQLAPASPIEAPATPSAQSLATDVVDAAASDSEDQSAETPMTLTPRVVSNGPVAQSLDLSAETPAKSIVSSVQAVPNYFLPELVPANNVVAHGYLERTPTKSGTSKWGGIIKLRREAIVMNTMKTAGGVFPGLKDMWYPVITEWMKGFKAKPDRHTVDNAVKALIQNRKLKRFEFTHPEPNKAGNTHKLDIIMEPQIDPNSYQVRSLQKAMIDAYPKKYMPKEVNVDRTLYTTTPTTDSKKHYRENYPEDATVTVKSLKSSEADTPSRKTSTMVGDVTVKRTAKGKQAGSETEISALQGNLLLHTEQVFHEPSGTFGTHPIESTQTAPSKPLRKKPGPKPKAKATSSPMATRQKSAQGAMLPPALPYGTGVIPFAGHHAPGFPPLPLYTQVNGIHGSPLGHSPSAMPTTLSNSTPLRFYPGPELPKHPLLPFARSTQPDTLLAQSQTPNSTTPSPLGTRSAQHVSSINTPQVPNGTPITAEKPQSAGDAASIGDTGAVQSKETLVRIHPKTGKPMRPFKSRKPRSKKVSPPNTIATQDSASAHHESLQQPNSQPSLQPVYPILATAQPGVRIPPLSMMQTPSSQTLLGQPTPPYQYKARNTATNGANGVVSKHANANSKSSSKRPQRKKTNTAKLTIEDVKRLPLAVALVKSLCSGIVGKRTVDWEIVAHAFSFQYANETLTIRWRNEMSKDGAQERFEKLQQGLQDSFLAAYEKDELPIINFDDIHNVDWPALLRWAEKTVVSYDAEIPIENLPASRDLLERDLHVHLSDVRTFDNDKFFASTDISNRSTMLAKMPYSVSQSNHGVTNEESVEDDKDLILAKSWARATAMTKDQNFNEHAATQKLSQLDRETLNLSVEQMLSAKTLVRAKSGRIVQGRNLHIAHDVLKQFKRWPGRKEEHLYLKKVAAARTKLVTHFEANDQLELDPDVNEAEILVLTNMVAQGQLKISMNLPERNDDVNAPHPRLSKWPCIGFRGGDNKIEQSMFRFPVVYTKTSAFTAEHGLESGVPIPEQPVGEFDQCIPFWIDIHGNLLDDVWDMTMRSILHLVVYRFGSTTKELDKALNGSLWPWEIDMVLQWMEETGLIERYGSGKEENGVWKGAWKAVEWWYCAFTREVATWAAQDNVTNGTK